MNQNFLNEIAESVRRSGGTLDISITPSRLRQPARLLSSSKSNHGLDAAVYTSITHRARFAPTPGGSLAPLDVLPYLDGSTWKVKVNPGFVLFTGPGTDFAPIREYFPITGTGEGSPYSVSNGDVVYVHVSTNGRCKPTTAVIEVESSTPTNIHYLPATSESPDGTGGEYFYELARVAISGGVLSLTKVHVGGCIELQNILWASKSDGDGVAILKEFDEAEGKYNLRKVKAKDDSPLQVNASSDGNAVEIEGNGYDTTVTDSKKFTIVVKDGIVESATDSSVPGVTCIFQLRYQTIHDSETTEDSGWKLHFNDGILEEAYSTLNGGTDWTPVSGFESIHVLVNNNIT